MLFAVVRCRCARCCKFVAVCWSLVVCYLPLFVTGAGVICGNGRWCLLLSVVFVDV